MTQQYTRNTLSSTLVTQIKKIKVLMLDIDGVLTDGRIIMANSGDEIKFFDVHDGFGMVLLNRAGLKTIIVTANKTKIVARRAKTLGVLKVYQNCFDKLETFRQILQTLKITPEEVCFIGDDLIDLPILRRVGFAVTVPNCVEEVRSKVHYVTKKHGGRGAVREITNLILKTQGKWEQVTNKYFR